MNQGKENEALFRASLDQAEEEFDTIILYCPLILDDYYYHLDLPIRLERNKKYLSHFEEKLNKTKFAWRMIIAPTHFKERKFRAIIENPLYKIKKVIFPKEEKTLKKWLKEECSNNVIGYTIHELEATNTPKQKEYLTSTGTLQRKGHHHKGHHHKDDGSSLLSDYN